MTITETHTETGREDTLVETWSTWKSVCCFIKRRLQQMNDTRNNAKKSKKSSWLEL